MVADNPWFPPPPAPPRAGKGPPKRMPPTPILPPDAIIGTFWPQEKPEDHTMKTVPELLREAADTYEQRNTLYGDNYKRFGEVMLALLPRGIKLETKEDWNRFGVFFHVVGKVTRYAANINEGGHQDSAHDLAVYASMLEELTKGNR